MKSVIKKIFLVIGILLLPLIGYLIYFAARSAPVGTSYAAKMVCSCIFDSGRTFESAWNQDVSEAKKYHVQVKVDEADKSVTAFLPGPIKVARKAVYREGLGCTLTNGVTEEQLRKQGNVDLTPMPQGQENLPWPTGDVMPEGPPPSGVDMQKLNAAVDEAFTEPDPAHPRNTRAIIVVYDGRIIAEKYAPGFTKDTRLIGWSMTKSVTSALVGILVGKGKLSVNDPAPVPEWQQPGDPRGKITMDQLLHMSSGLKFEEEYENKIYSDCSSDLFVVSDSGAYAANKPLETEPGGKWHYSSGTTNIISRIIRQTVGGTDADYFEFPRRELFDKIGMRSAIIEPDPSGTFLGSSHMYATARDWARFGLLYYNDGVWDGVRILPEGWVTYTQTPAPKAPPDQGYGAQFWLNTGGPNRWMPKLPEDLFSTWGHEHQYVTIIPSRKLVTVRLGYTIDEYKSWDLQQFILNVLDALPKS